MRKKSGVKPKFAVVLALAVVLVLLYYGYQAEWFKNVGGDNVGAVSASVSSTSGKLVTGAKAVSSSTSSPQPVITVTSWPTFEMKLDSAGNENNLVVKTEYSVTAKNGKIYLPINWGTMSIKNTLDQYAWPKTIETKSLDSVSVVYCGWGSSCYEIPKDKTVRFVSRQVYNPLIMFGGVYTAKLDWLYFSLGATDTDFYFKPFPTSTSKLNTVTVVGEKSPYIYTTSVNANWGQKFTIQGVRLTGTTPVFSGCSGKLTVVSQSDTSITLVMDKTSFTTPLCHLTFSHPTYGASNGALLTMEDVVVLVPANGEIWAKDQLKLIKWQAICGSQYCPAEEITLKLIGKAFEGTIARANLSSQQWNWKVGTLESGVLPVDAGPLQIQLCRKSGFCVMSKGFFNIVSSPTIKVLSPNGGEAWTPGTLQTIKWSGVNLPSDAYISLTLRNKATLVSYPIANSLRPSQTEFSYVAPLVPAGSNYIVSATVFYGGNQVNDDSDNYFTIRSTPPTAPKPLITFISSDEQVITDDGNDDDSGIFTIKYRVEAVGGPIFISDSPKALATTTAPSNVSDGMGVLYMVDEAGTPTTADISAVVTFTTGDGATDSGVVNGVKLDDGESTEMTLTVNRTNSGDSTDDGLYRVFLKGIGWSALFDSPNFQIYRYGLENYKTDPVSLN